MAYSAPSPSAVHFDLATGYEAPSGLLIFDGTPADAFDASLVLGGETGNQPLRLGYRYGEDQIAVAVHAITRRPTAAIFAAELFPTAVAGQTLRPVATLKVFDVRLAEIVATTRRPVCALASDYDPNLLSDTVGATDEGWQGAGALQVEGLSTHAHAIPTALVARSEWGSAAGTPGPAVASWSDALALPGIALDGWRPADARACGATQRWSDTDKVQAPGTDIWSPAAPLRTQSRERWKPRMPHFDTRDDIDPTRDFALRTLAAYVLDPLQVDFPGGPYIPADRVARSGQQAPSWRGAVQVSSGFLFRPQTGAFLPLSGIDIWDRAGLVLYVHRVVPPEPPEPWAPSWTARLCLGYPLPGALLDLGVLGCAYVPAAAIPRRRSYLVHHAISLVRLPDRLPVAHAALALSIDADAWAWQWSGTLLGSAALDAVMPSALGEPVVLEAAIDGVAWHLLVEDWSEDRSHGQRRIAASGRGLSAWLGDPYELAAAGTLADARSIQQAMAELLPLGSGWSLAFADGTPDWVLPAGAWSWDALAPIQAMQAAASECGLVIVPARTSRALTVQPRYPILPWDFASADPDLVVPDSAIVRLARRQAIPSQANAVYVHGEEVGGILAQVYRTGSAADRLAPTAVHPWIAHADGARLLGSRILAAHATQPEIRSITIPLGGEDFPLLEIGQLLAVESSGVGDDVRGLVNGVSITVDNGAATVRQTATIGEETPNLWARWKRLLPETPLLAGEIATAYADGTCAVDLIGGGSIRVRGDGDPGDAVWVRGGRIEGPAPTLSAISLEV